MNTIGTKLKLSAQRALWGHVPACLRFASIQKNENTIEWRCIFDSEATDDDFELARMAGTEIISDFTPETKINEDIRIVPFPEKPTNLEFLVFSRHEHNYYKDE